MDTKELSRLANQDILSMTEASWKKYRLQVKAELDKMEALLRGVRHALEMYRVHERKGE